MGDCIFCNIVANRERASIVHQDTYCIVIMDLHPLTAGHTLVIPRTHHQYLRELPPELRHHVFTVAEAVMRAQRVTYECAGANLVLNDGPVANQTVPHAHVHLIPRRRGDLGHVARGLARRAFPALQRRAGRGRLDGEAMRLAAALPALNK